MLTVDVLGPLVVSINGQLVKLSSPKLRVLLAAQAMEAGSVVSVERLAGALWDDEYPECRLTA